MVRKFIFVNIAGNKRNTFNTQSILHIYIINCISKYIKS